jgi:hypothetical protein
VCVVLCVCVLCWRASAGVCERGRGCVPVSGSGWFPVRRRWLHQRVAFARGTCGGRCCPWARRSA